MCYWYSSHSIHSCWVYPRTIISQHTSTSFLLRASLAFISIGVNPSSLAHKCALVVLPIPGDPVISTARKTFIPLFPGFLNPHFTLDGLQTDDRMDEWKWGSKERKRNHTSHVTIVEVSRLGLCFRKLLSGFVARNGLSRAVFWGQPSSRPGPPLSPSALSFPFPSQPFWYRHAPSPVSSSSFHRPFRCLDLFV